MTARAEAARLRLRESADLVEARQAMRRLAEHLGYDRFDQVQLATGASELGRAVMTHGGGELAICFSNGRPARLVIEVHGTDAAAADLELSPEFLAARRLIGGSADDGGRAGGVTLSRLLPSGRRELDTTAIKAVLRRPPADLQAEVAAQSAEIVGLLEELRRRDAELEETNRGVLALYSELDERAEAVRQASDERSRFLSNVTHELRTPLSSILALSRLLQEDPTALTPDHLKQVGYIQKSAQDLYDFVSDLLDLAKVEAGKVEVHPVQFEVADLFGALRGMFRPLAVDPDVNLTFELAKIPSLTTDEGKVAQILRNLVSNGLKFTEHGGVKVSAKYDELADMVVFEVRDTGLGIPEADRERIFEEFVQVGPGQRPSGRGSGLGLPLSRHLAELLGGTLTVNSEVGAGSEFTLRIPPIYRASGPAAGAQVILVVDDDDVSRYVVREHLERAGWRVVEAATGEMALALAREGTAAGIVLDLIMPGMSGFEVLDRLGDDPASSAVPVAIRTSLPVSDIDPRSVDRAVGVFSKDDFSLEPLLNALTGAGRRTVAPGDDRA